jgi:hypothetical protein
MKLRYYYYDNNKIHFSICLFFAFWLAASVNWTFEDQEAPGVLIADVLYYLGCIIRLFLVQSVLSFL